MYNELKEKKEKLEQELKKLEDELNSLQTKFLYRTVLKHSSRVRKLNIRINDIKVMLDKYRMSVNAFQDIINNNEVTQIIIEQEDIDMINGGVSEYVINSYSNSHLSIESINDLILVHKTRYIPHNDTIYTPKSTGAKNYFTIQLGGKDRKIEWQVANDSVHFSVNGPVTDHSSGSWSDCKYAVLVPYADVDTSNLVGTSFEDTFFEGNVKLPDSAIIVCPKSDIEKVKSQNLNVKVYGYLDVELDDAIRCILIYLKKKVKMISTGSDWAENFNEKDNKMAKMIISDYGITLNDVPHRMSDNHFKRSFNKSLDCLISVLRLIKNDNIQLSYQEIANITKKMSGFVSTEDGISFNIAQIMNEYVDGVFAALISENLLQEDLNLIKNIKAEILKELSIVINKIDEYRNINDVSSSLLIDCFNCINTFLLCTMNEQFAKGKNDDIKLDNEFQDYSLK